MTEINASSTNEQQGTAFLVPSSLKFVCEAIDRFTANDNQYPESDFLSLLKTLIPTERFFIASYFCQLPWNVFSVKVLGNLNRLRILTATEYILSQTDYEHIQLVLNDFLETDFDLLANLILNGHFDLMIGSKITEYVDESIRRLFADLVTDPKLNSFSYLRALRIHITDELIVKFINNHIKIILQLDKRSTKTAFANFNDWMKQNSGDCELVNNFYKNAIFEYEHEPLKVLLNLSTCDNFLGWKNYLRLLGLISKNGSPQCCSFIKRFLKERLKLIAGNGSREAMAHLLLSIRTVLLFQEDKTETYAKWYKQHIGDMKFVFNATEFKTMMNVLTDLVPYETNEEYIEVHVKITISAPIMCSQLCRDYKILCKTRIFDIIDCSRILEDEEGILISDVE